MEMIYLFDWGDTLMVDSLEQSGPMCDWPEVKAVDGALETLALLSKHHRIYIATNAANSTEREIKRAFERVGLARYINGYFCQSNLGISKGTPAFFDAIAQRLGVNPNKLIMVGDSFGNDIIPAIAAGLSAIWLAPNINSTQLADGIIQVRGLREIGL
ncbi:HAD family hydrolase [Vibrio rumoiensis]|uniref:HAD family hydrolase n=1 Tax=Vibrio rumoiensis TaxID=76258 RepID=A0ABW7IZF7_9VIBR